MTRMGPAPEVISSAHVHHLRLVAITIEHLCAPQEERRIGEDVVFQHDGLRDLLERPRQSGRDTHVAAQICFRKIANDAAVGIQPLYDCARSSAPRNVFGVVGTRAVGDCEDKLRVEQRKIVSTTRSSDATRLNKKSTIGTVLAVIPVRLD